MAASDHPTCVLNARFVLTYQVEVTDLFVRDTLNMRRHTSLSMRVLTAVDVPLGMRLCGQAGWNQTDADWRRFLGLEPDGCFVGICDSRAVATLTTCIFDSCAWIGMMLVDSQMRGRGVGRAMMEHALAHLAARGVASVRLDATPLGQPLYEKLGFAAQFWLDRYALAAPTAPPQHPDVEPVSAQLLADVLSLDRRATATDRRRLVELLLAEQPEHSRLLRREGTVVGYITARRGASAWQIGPCIAQGEAGSVLLDDALARLAGEPVFVDIPEAQAQARRWAARHGLAPQRRLLRMCRGAAVDDDLALLWTSSGPEKG